MRYRPSPLSIPGFGAGLTINTMNAIDISIDRDDYETAVILGRALQGILECELRALPTPRRKYWGGDKIYDYMATITIFDAGLKVLTRVVTHCVGEVPSWLRDELDDIRNFLIKAGAFKGG